MPLKNFKLLFVEDDKSTQEQMKMLLEDDVKEFIQAYNGDEGYQMFLKTQPDIILTDINMPVSGLELTRKIKALDKTIPVIIMSAYDDKENLLEFINLCTNGFIKKPIDMTLLYQQLNKVATLLQTQKQFVSQKKEKIKNLYKLAHYDTLTNIANRFLFDLELDKAIEQARTKNSMFALFFIDLDYFKSINDNYGHEAGDLALKSVVDTILSLISEDDLLARRSGDEFLLIVKNITNTSSLEDLANQILLNLEEPFVYKNKKIQLSASIGVSRYPQDARDKGDLLKLADRAMYHAKNSGKARYSFAKELSSIGNEKSGENKIIINKELYWDLYNSCLIFQKKEIILTKNETYLLTLLFSSPYYRAEYSKIYLYIWGENCNSKNESLKTLVKNLRTKLPVNILKNIFNVGYKIEFD